MTVKLTEDEQYQYEERAAIMEYDSGMPRAHAERLAMEEVIRRRNESL